MIHRSTNRQPISGPSLPRIGTPSMTALLALPRVPIVNRLRRPEFYSAQAHADGAIGKLAQPILKEFGIRTVASGIVNGRNGGDHGYVAR